MKRFALILILACLCCATVIRAGNAAQTSERWDAYWKLPTKYPYWLAVILAPFGVADAQASVGFGAMSQDDPCKGANLYMRAAKQNHFFAQGQLSGYYHLAGMLDRDPEKFKKSFLWYLHFASHFPNEKDESRAIADMLKLTPEQESEVREKFKSWKPEDELPIEPASCPGTVLDW